MGWANCGTDSQGRPIGYAHGGECDWPGCEAQIDRGMDYACGKMHGEGVDRCEGYFCFEHQAYATDAEGELMVQGPRCKACAWAIEHVPLGEEWPSREDLVSMVRNMPPAGLVQLSTLPPDTWRGRLVFHPMTQICGVPYWREADVPKDHPRVMDPGEQQLYLYDTGVVLSHDPGHYLGRPEVTFRLWGTQMSTLHYGAHNLWCFPDASRDEGWMETHQ
jgi:hypothetical protein